jgi:DnaJ like chaperone protein
MAWWGKLVGAAFGLMVGGPVGALFGAAVGHQVDRGGGPLPWRGRGGLQPLEGPFFVATFAVMGHIAKADGRVSANEIQVAEAVMAHLHLDPAFRRLAIGHFHQGKGGDFDLDAALGSLRQAVADRPDLMQLFLEIQLHAAYADGVMSPAGRRLIQRICRRLEITPSLCARLEAAVRRERATHDRAHAGAPGASGPSIDEAYALLGVDPSTEPEAITRAYRRLLSRHHPDKHAAKGLSDATMKAAAQKTFEIRQAYERIRAVRRF